MRLLFGISKSGFPVIVHILLGKLYYVEAGAAPSALQTATSVSTFSNFSLYISFRTDVKNLFNNQIFLCWKYFLYLHDLNDSATFLYEEIIC